MRDSDLAELMSASPDDRKGAFAAAADELGVRPEFVEKDLWVCWTLDMLFNRVGPGPRLLFKGGTSLSKAWGGIVSRFSEDIDVSVFREDLGHPASVSDLAAMGRTARKRALDGLRDSCRSFLFDDLGPKLSSLANASAASFGMPAGSIRVERASVEDDADGQTLNLVYPTLYETSAFAANVRPWVKIESGARSDHDPNEIVSVEPYLSAVLPDMDLRVDGVRAIRPERTLWDKLRILHEQRSWFEARGVVHKDGLRLSRHYYDVHKLVGTEAGDATLDDHALMDACVSHGRIFFDRKDHRLDLAVPGTLALVPYGPMADLLERDYEATKPMLFGERPTWAEIVATLEAVETRINAPAPRP